MVERVPKVAAVSVAALSAVVLSGTMASAAYAGAPQPELMDEASQRYCEQYTRELANFLLTEGPPADVALMEEAYSMLDTGEWTVSSTTLASKPGESPHHWVVDVRCGSASPFEDLNGDVELTYTLQLDPNTGEIDQLTD